MSSSLSQDSNWQPRLAKSANDCVDDYRLSVMSIQDTIMGTKGFLGPDLGAMRGIRSVGAFAARAAGIIVDEAGRLRCPGGPNANQFTDMQMSNCLAPNMRPAMAAVGRRLKATVDKLGALGTQAMEEDGSSSGAVSAMAAASVLDSPDFDWSNPDMATSRASRLGSMVSRMLGRTGLSNILNGLVSRGKISEATKEHIDDVVDAMDSQVAARTAETMFGLAEQPLGNPDVITPRVSTDTTPNETSAPATATPGNEPQRSELGGRTTPFAEMRTTRREVRRDQVEGDVSRASEEIAPPTPKELNESVMKMLGFDEQDIEEAAITFDGNWSKGSSRELVHIAGRHKVSQAIKNPRAIVDALNQWRAELSGGRLRTNGRSEGMIDQNGAAVAVSSAPMIQNSVMPRRIANPVHGDDHPQTNEHLFVHHVKDFQGRGETYVRPAERTAAKGRYTSTRMLYDAVRAAGPASDKQLIDSSAEAATILGETLVRQIVGSTDYSHVEMDHQFLVALPSLIAHVKETRGEAAAAALKDLVDAKVEKDRAIYELTSPVRNAGDAEKAYDLIIDSKKAAEIQRANDKLVDATRRWMETSDDPLSDFMAVGGEASNLNPENPFSFAQIEATRESMMMHVVNSMVRGPAMIPFPELDQQALRRMTPQRYFARVASLREMEKERKKNRDKQGKLKDVSIIGRQEEEFLKGDVATKEEDYAQLESVGYSVHYVSGVNGGTGYLGEVASHTKNSGVSAHDEFVVWHNKRPGTPFAHFQSAPEMPVGLFKYSGVNQAYGSVAAIPRDRPLGQFIVPIRSGSLSERSEALEAQELVQLFDENWSGSSTAQTSIMLARAVAEEFGAVHKRGRFDTDDLEEKGVMSAEAKDAARQIARGIAEGTQSALREIGVTHVQAFRGFQIGEEGGALRAELARVVDEMRQSFESGSRDPAILDGTGERPRQDAVISIDVKQLSKRGITSWSTNFSQAYDNFGGKERYILAAPLPVENIFGMAVLGFSNAGENEVVPFFRLSEPSPVFLWHKVGIVGPEKNRLESELYAIGGVGISRPPVMPSDDIPIPKSPFAPEQPTFSQEQIDSVFEGSSDGF